MSVHSIGNGLRMPKSREHSLQAPTNFLFTTNTASGPYSFRWHPKRGLIICVFLKLTRPSKAGIVSRENLDDRLKI